MPLHPGEQRVVDLPVERPAITETTALGAAFLAGLQVGVYPDTARLAALWRREKAFAPAMAAEESERLYAGWRAAVARVRSNVSELAAPSRSRAICPRVRFLPPHGAISVQIGEPHRTRVRGRRRFS